MKEGLWAILAFVLAWAVAQVAKVIILIVTAHEEWNFSKIMKTLVQSGGMPSGHVAGLGGIAMFLGLSFGFDSVNFAMMLAVTLIVAYDALNVRRAVGEQGKALKNLVHRNFKMAEGHKLAEVVAGAVIGVLLGAAMYGLSLAI